MRVVLPIISYECLWLVIEFNKVLFDVTVNSAFVECDALKYCTTDVILKLQSCIALFTAYLRKKTDHHLDLCEQLRVGQYLVVLC